MKSSKGRLCTWGWGYHGQTGHAQVPLAPRVQALYYPAPLFITPHPPHSHSSHQLQQHDTAHHNTQPRNTQPHNAHITHIGCGHFHALACAPAVDGTSAVLYGWGYNEGQQLGTQQPHAGYRPDTVPTPQLIPWNSGAIRKVTGSGVASALLTHSGQLFTWGSNKRGQLGRDTSSSASHNSSAHSNTHSNNNNDTDSNAHTPGIVHRLINEEIVDVALGWGHGLALSSDKKVFSWGWGEQGQLGLGNYAHSPLPEEIESVRGLGASSITTGADCSAIVTESGEVYMFGRNEYWAGLPTEFYRSGETRGLHTPTKLSLPEPVSQLACGLGHFAALTASGTVLTWGTGNEGQLGTGSTDACTIPTPMALGLGPDDKVVKVACGRVHTTLLTQQGRLYTCGYGRFGRLGLGDEETQPVPVEIVIDDIDSTDSTDNTAPWRVTDVACGYDFTLALIQ
eukprot:TRINITY_DN8475_c0_g1_i1.p1 TRINITY_DN8475_c0_g1~~TRINITY_DN8475_c0_g1_i1.p1  ORF type:complete len:453 (-),score=68.11 TRINITY_DN8475_c0_g1_i1:828-2186(-)